eukprot:m.426086 g.426086  ORF g.426086 m.426086 type:complete len:154 (+) comp56317_c0_seq1:851-1312(+)
MCNIGTLYQTGDGVRKDLSKGMRWFTKAAKAGNVAAMCTLAWCHRYGGDGVSVDLAQAKKWYSKAAKLGSADAQFDLGNLFEYGDDDGTGPPDTTTQYSVDDLVEAIKLYDLAAKQGHVNAKTALAAIMGCACGNPTCRYDVALEVWRRASRK